MVKKKEEEKPKKSKNEILEQIKAEKKEFCKTVEKKLDKFIEESRATFLDIRKSMKKHRESSQNLIDITSNCSETLLNVLVAIRQNEYLQAYYPEQKGYPEQKVAGVHPFVAERDNKQKKHGKS